VQDAPQTVAPDGQHGEVKEDDIPLVLLSLRCGMSSSEYRYWLTTRRVGHYTLYRPPHSPEPTQEASVTGGEIRV